MKIKADVLIPAAIGGFVVAWAFERWLENQDLINPDELGLGDRVGHQAGNPFPGTGATSPGGATNTPGWYTLTGHHHCGVDANGSFSAGCLCTDPKKCKGNAGTGAAYCAAHQSECWPTNETNWCAYWYASDQKYCNLCNGWAYTGPDGSGAKACPASLTGGAAPAATPAAAAPAATPAAKPAPSAGTTGQQARATTAAARGHVNPPRPATPNSPGNSCVNNICPLQ